MSFKPEFCYNSEDDRKAVQGGLFNIFLMAMIAMLIVLFILAYTKTLDLTTNIVSMIALAGIFGVSAYYYWQHRNAALCREREVKTTKPF